MLSLGFIIFFDGSFESVLYVGAAIDAGAIASPAGKLQLSLNFLAVEGL